MSLAETILLLFSNAIIVVTASAIGHLRSKI
jgi:hypothetical protein